MSEVLLHIGDFRIRRRETTEERLASIRRADRRYCEYMATHEPFRKIDEPGRRSLLGECLRLAHSTLEVEVSFKARRFEWVEEILNRR